VRYLSSLVQLTIVFLTLSCGKKEVLPWPAQVQLVGLSQAETTIVMNSLKGFSDARPGTTFYYDSHPQQFQITISKLDPTSDNSSKAGLATYDNTFCKVQINDLIFTDSYSDYVDPVVWHELGHCSGMVHSPNEKDIMYYTARPKSYYTTNAIQNFFSSFANLINL
jgi:hypothetical protein